MAGADLCDKLDLSEFFSYNRGIQPELFSKLAPLSRVLPERFTVRQYSTNEDSMPEYKIPETIKELFRSLEIISSVFKDLTLPNLDWFDRHDWIMAERYALSLAHEKKFDAAHEIFEAIMYDRTLSRYRSPISRTTLTRYNDERYSFRDTANRKGHLGYEGMFIYAKVCIEVPLPRRGKRRARALLSNLVQATPTGCKPLRLAIIRVEAIELLQQLGRTKAGKINLAEELVRAKERRTLLMST